MSVPLLSAVAVAKSYRRGSETVTAVEGVSAALTAGSVHLLTGPSGSGKTTLLNILAGWEQPDAGEILWKGDPVDPGSLGWSQLAVVPQRVGLFPELTVDENAVLPLRVSGGHQPDLDALLGRLGLEGLGDAFPDELSAGQQQRVAVARALSIGPEALLIDEPTSSQDEEHARIVLAAVRAAAGDGSMCLVASHDPIAAEFADRVLDIRDGRVAEELA
jgi:ABC-type lipoprotein export system ATPase subunit